MKLVIVLAVVIPILLNRQSKAKRSEKDYSRGLFEGKSKGGPNQTNRISSNMPIVIILSTQRLSHSSIYSGYFYSPSSIQYYSEALPPQHGYCAGVSRLIATGNCE